MKIQFKSKRLYLLLGSNLIFASAVNFINPFLLISLSMELSLNPKVISTLFLFGLAFSAVLSWFLSSRSKVMLNTLLFAPAGFVLICFSLAFIIKISLGSLVYLFIPVIYCCYRTLIVLVNSLNYFLYLKGSSASEARSAISLKNTFSALGALAGGSLAGQVYEKQGFYGCLFISGILFAINIAVYISVVIILRKNDLLQIKSMEEHNSGNNLLNVKFSKSGVVFAAIGASLVGIFGSQVFSFIPLIVVRSEVSLGKVISTAYMINSLIMLVLSVPVNYVVSKIFSPFARFVVGISCYFLSLSFLSTMPLNYLIVSICVAISSIGELHTSVAGIELIRTVARDEKDLQKGLSLFTLLFGLIGTGGGQFIGAMAAEAGSLGRLSIWIAFCLCSILFLIVSLIPRGRFAETNNGI